MKASVIIAILVAGVGLVGHAASEEAVYFGPQREIRSLENVLEALGKPLVIDTRLRPRYQVGAMVWGVISAANDKDAPKTILNEFSIKDFVGLNYWDDEECSSDRLKERRNFCEKLATNQLSQPDGKDSPRDEFIRSNLAKYCLTIFEHIDGECPFKTLRARIAADVPILEAFETAVFRAMLDRNSICLPGWECVKDWTHNKAVDEVIHKMSKFDSSKVDRIKQVCSILSKEGVLDGERKKAFLAASHAVWPNYLQICKHVVKKFPIRP